MVYVRLELAWTDEAGTYHPAGAMVDVDAATLATLQEEGVVAEPPGDDAGTDTGWQDPDRLPAS